jgi:hypothetical protein
MFDARTVARMRGALSRRPATKKSALPRTNRATARPIAISAVE